MFQICRYGGFFWRRYPGAVAEWAKEALTERGVGGSIPRGIGKKEIGRGCRTARLVRVPIGTWGL